MNYKKAFYSKLEDCYLGVKIKDFHKANIAKSGFSNLLKIKEQYFAHIKAYLESQIESEPLSHDIYNKLFTFFDSYLNESGTPFFTDTPIYKNIYAKVYSNSKDTSLFYKTQNLYYVKSDILYQSLTLSDEQENYEVVFDAREYQQNADNTKNKVLFKLDSISCNELTNTDEESHNQILIKVINQKDLFPELNNVFKQNSSEFSEEFLKSLKQKKLKFNEESLKKIFRSYKKQSEIDFFIHKNAKAFLQEQFDLWMFAYLYQESTIQEWNPNIIAHLQKIKNIAHEIIKLIADFENELKNIWLKPKFAKKVEYVFSVDTILQYANNANALLESIANDKGFEEQIKEWQELNLIDETFDREDFIVSLRGKAEAIYNHAKNRDSIVGTQIVDCHEAEPLAMTDSASTESSNLYYSQPALAGEESQNIKSQEIFRFAQYDKEANCHSEVLRSKAEESKNNKYRYLPIDTKHFTKETKYQILSSFENLESLLNGELIKSDNFQALNTLMPKYQGKIDLIYIDPPYNAPASEIIYKNNFKDSTWLSMMENRLRIGKEFLKYDKGLINIAIDDIELFNLGVLCDEVFGTENHISTISVLCNPQGRVANNISKNSEFNLLYAKNSTNFTIDIFKTNDFSQNTSLIRTGTNSRREERPYRFFPILEKNCQLSMITDEEYHDIYTKEQGFNDKYMQQLKEKYTQRGFNFILPMSKMGEYLVWQREFSRIKEELNTYIFKNGKIFTPFLEKEKPKTLWTDKRFSNPEYGTELAKNILNIDVTQNTPKSVYTIMKFLEMTYKDSIILDFFGGSGTTAHAVLELNREGSNRKFMLVEQGEHFYNVMIPRIKKVAFSSEWKDGKLKGNKQIKPLSVAFRYYELESYEEALANCEYVLKDFCHSEVLRSKAEESHGLEQHGLYKGKDYAKAEAILDYRKSRKLIDRLNKGEIVCLDMHTEYRQDFDIFQTIANLMGWKIKRLFLDSKGIEFCEFDNGEILSLDSLDLAKYPKLKNLIWWE